MQRFFKMQMNILAVIVAVCVITFPMKVYAKINWGGVAASWYPIYVKLEPWIPRFALVIEIIGLMEMFQGYAADGAYGIVKGLDKAIGGLVLAFVWIAVKRIYA